MLAYTLHSASNAISNEGRLAIKAHDDRYRAHVVALLDLQRRLDAVDNKLESPAYVVNDRSGILHRADTVTLQGFDYLRVSPCGWRYSQSRGTLLKEVPEAFFASTGV